MSDYLKKIQEIVNEALEAAGSAQIKGAINWGDLSCTEVCRCEDQDGDVKLHIGIEEAAPNNPALAEYVIAWLGTQSALQIKEYVVVITDW
jgi:hypothetical protein